jgi:hypothetical protein
MNEIIFEIQGSAAEPYRVSFFRRSENNLSAYCTCAAGANGQYCKHRFEILSGGQTGVVSVNTHEISLVQSWLPGTDIEKAMAHLAELETEAARIKAKVSLAKKAVAVAMRD